MNFLWNTYLGKLFMTFLISMVPVLELRGAIPIATANGLGYWVAFVVAVLGNMLPVPFIIIFIRKIFAWMRKHLPWLDGFVSRLEARADKHKEKVLKYEFWGLFLLVAIPLPGTGAWTGALVAAMLDMQLKRALPAIFFGVIAAGLVVSMVTLGFVHIF